MPEEVPVTVTVGGEPVVTDPKTGSVPLGNLEPTGGLTLEGEEDVVHEP